MGFAEIMEKGGILMWPILLCSVVSLTVLLERIWAFRKKTVMPDSDFIFRLAKTADVAEFTAEVKKRKDYLSSILLLVHEDDTNEDPVKLTEMYGKQFSTVVYRYTTIPGIMATVSPLLGLLGTVLGMIKMFSDFTAAQGNPMILAGGIWEALITTAAGLFVAIPSLVVYRYLSYRAGKVLSDIEFMLEKILLYRSGRVKSQSF